MRKALLCAAGLFICLVLCGQVKILSVIGSSTAAGTGASAPDSAYLGRLNYYYNNLGITLTVYNLAQGGYDCYMGLPTSYITNPPPGFTMHNQPDPNRNVTAALTFNPDVVLVHFPTNGYQNLDWSIPHIVQCHQKIYDSVVALGKVCFIATPQPRQDGGTFGTPESRQKLHLIRDSIMIQFGNHAIDFWTGIALPDNTINPIYSAGDNIHLNNAGHKELFKRVRDKDIFGLGLINRAINSGSWEDPLTWGNEYVPTIADSVVILPGKTVTINASTQVRALYVHPTATLNIASPAILKVGN